MLSPVKTDVPSSSETRLRKNWSGERPRLRSDESWISLSVIASEIQSNGRWGLRWLGVAAET